MTAKSQRVCLRSASSADVLAAPPAAIGSFFFSEWQSALGTGASTVACALLAYPRWHSPWAISLVLIAQAVPAVELLGVRHAFLVVALVVFSVGLLTIWSLRGQGPQVQPTQEEMNGQEEMSL